MSKVFRGGVPYAVDVNRLTDAFPVPALTEGRVIKHAELEAVIEAKTGDQRYYGVVNSWMSKMLWRNNIFMIWEPAVGIKILNNAERMAYGELRTRQKIGQTLRATKIVEWVDASQLDDVGQRRLDHQKRVMGAMREALMTGKKEMAIDLAPVQSLPKPRPAALLTEATKPTT